MASKGKGKGKSKYTDHNIDHMSQYLKYKKKYLELKSVQAGGKCFVSKDKKK